MTPPECAVKCRGSVKCLRNDCFAVQTAFYFQKELGFSWFLVSFLHKIDVFIRILMILDLLEVYDSLRPFKIHISTCVL